MVSLNRKFLIKIGKFVFGAVGIYIFAYILDIGLTLTINEPTSFPLAVVRYLPVNLLMLVVAYLARDVEGLGVKRGVGIGAAWRAMLQLFPAAIHFAFLEGTFTYGFKYVTGFSKILLLAPPLLFYTLFPIGLVLSVFGIYLLADNLTDRTLSLWPGYTWDEVLSIIGALLFVFMIIHEPGHILFAFLFGVPVRGIGIIFPVGAYTALQGGVEISLFGFWFLTMGGNIMTLIISILAKDALYNKFIRHVGIIASMSTILNAQIVPGASIDGTLVFMTFLKQNIFLGIATAVVQYLFVAVSTQILWQYLKKEAYGSLPLYHDRPRSKDKSLGEKYEEVWGTQ